jgi:iron complex outermembrane receptor protein
MTRSRNTTGHLRSNVAGRPRDYPLHVLRRLPLASAISAILAGGVPAAHAATEVESTTLEEVVVTAQKRTENLQDVPISIQALGNEKLEELNIVNIDDYVKYLSGVTTVKSLGQGGNGIGTTHVYMRGVVSGQDGNHSASQPSVGTYFDEQPVTTIDGTIDIHVYDIARIEVLEGPQGTLYGASSEAGTIRIISNKPDPTKFSAAYDITGNSIDHGGYGSVVEGYVNFPLTPVAAIRLVGWSEHDGGYISNVAGTNAAAGIIDGVRTFPTSGTTLNNAASVSNNYNTSETQGGRAALKLDIGDNWTVTPSFMGQRLAASGFFGYDPAVGDLKLVHSGPENTQDSFTQTALTVEGKVSDFDIVYAGGWLVRNTHSIADYSDYSYFYDKYFGSGANWLSGAGIKGVSPQIMPQEFVLTTGHYTKWSNELRVSTPQQYAVKGLLGVFAERQVHEIWEDYTIPGAGGNPYTVNPGGLSQNLKMPGLSNDTIWLTDEERVDRDSAVFGQATWDIDPKWSIIGGMRFYHYDNSLQGFYGYSAGYQNLTSFYPGQNICGPVGGTGGQPTYQPFHFAPCTDLNQTVSANGKTYRLTATYKFDADRLVYATYSTGYRPGGVNRVYDPNIKAIFPPYQEDTLTNYEIGWKTQWGGHRLRWNGAIFLENWDNFQFLYLGPNSVTVVQNAASAQIKGFETDVEWAAGHGLVLSGALTYLHAVTTANYCGPQATIPGTTQLSQNCPNQVNSYAVGNAPNGPEAPSGTQLPVAPKVKLNLIARETFPVGDWQGFVQGSGMYQTSTEPLLRLIDQQTIGQMPAYALFDASGGMQKNGLSWQVMMTNVADKRAQLTRFVECTTTTCNQPYIIPTQPRTTWIKFGQKF